MIIIILGGLGTLAGPLLGAIVFLLLEEFLPVVKMLTTFRHDWVDDVLSQGSWCTYRPGTIARLANALPQQEGNLVFASGDHA